MELACDTIIAHVQNKGYFISGADLVSLIRRNKVDIVQSLFVQLRKDSVPPARREFFISAVWDADIRTEDITTEMIAIFSSLIMHVHSLNAPDKDSSFRPRDRRRYGVYGHLLDDFEGRIS